MAKEDAEQFLDDEIYQDTDDDLDLFDLNEEESAQLLLWITMTVVMSLMMRICRCFTTDVCDLNGLMEIMYHQYRMINCSKAFRFCPCSWCVHHTRPSECFNLFYTEQIFRVVFVKWYTSYNCLIQQPWVNQDTAHTHICKTYVPQVVVLVHVMVYNSSSSIQPAWVNKGTNSQFRSFQQASKT